MTSTREYEQIVNPKLEFQTIFIHLYIWQQYIIIFDIYRGFILEGSVTGSSEGDQDTYDYSEGVTSFNSKDGRECAHRCCFIFISQREEKLMFMQKRMRNAMVNKIIWSGKTKAELYAYSSGDYAWWILNTAHHHKHTHLWSMVWAALCYRKSSQQQALDSLYTIMKQNQWKIWFILMARASATEDVKWSTCKQISKVYTRLKSGALMQPSVCYTKS